MAEKIVAVVSFSGLSGDGVIDLNASGPSGTLSGDRVAGVTNITSGSGTANADFGDYLAADGLLVQTSSGNLSTSRFVAVIVRES